MTQGITALGMKNTWPTNPDTYSENTVIHEGNVANILQSQEVRVKMNDNPLFCRAVDYVYGNHVLQAPNIRPLREIFPSLDLSAERNIIEYIGTRKVISHTHDKEIVGQNSKTQTRNTLAFHAWLLGSANGRLFTKTEGQYAFVSFIQESIDNWKNSSAQEREIIISKLDEIFRFVRNYMETLLPNPSAIDEIRDLYHTVNGNSEKEWLIAQVGRLCELDVNSKEFLNLTKIRYIFVNNYAPVVEGWNSWLKQKLAEARKFLDQHLASDPELRRHLQIASDFRYARAKLLSNEISEKEMEDCLAVLIGVFRGFLMERNPHSNCPSSCLNAENCRGNERCEHHLCRVVSIEHTSLFEWFKALVRKYTPYRSWEVPEANRAELDAFANTFLSLPHDSVWYEDLSALLENITETEHSMVDCQEYILLVIEEILVRMRGKGVENTKNSVHLFEWLKQYLEGLSSKHLHVYFIGRIYIQLANIYAGLALLPNGPDDQLSETFFIKWYNLLNAMNDAGKEEDAVKLGASFLQDYSWLFTKAISTDEVSFSPKLSENAHKNGDCLAHAGLKILKRTGVFKQHDHDVKLRINGAIKSHLVSSHADIPEFLDLVRRSIIKENGNVFNIEIGGKGSFKEELGDVVYSQEIPLGYGFYARTKYQIEHESAVKHDQIAQALKELEDQLAKHISRLTPPKYLKPEKPEDEVDWEKYAYYHNLLVPTTKDRISAWKNIIVTKVYQRKILWGKVDDDEATLDEKTVSSEMLARFRDAESGNPLRTDEIFKFLDLFGVYKDFSRFKILPEDFHYGKMLGVFSVNVRGDELSEADFATYCIQLAQLEHIDPKDVTIELIESDTLDLDDEVTCANIEKLKSFGFHIALDDFGTAASFLPRYKKMRQKWYLAAGDGVKFDKQYKMELREIIMAMKKEYGVSSISGFIAVLKEGYEKELHLEGSKDFQALVYEMLCKLDVESSTKSFVNMLDEMRKHHIKATIEQIEPNEAELLEVCDALWLAVQGYVFGKPKEILDARDVQGLARKTSRNVARMVQPHEGSKIHLVHAKH